MSERVRIGEILRFIGLEESPLLDELRREGLFESDWLDADEAEDLRIAAGLMRELGVNPAGVEVALHLRRRLRTLETRMERWLLLLRDETERR